MVAPLPVEKYSASAIARVAYTKDIEFSSCRQASKMKGLNTIALTVILITGSIVVREFREAARFLFVSVSYTQEIAHISRMNIECSCKYITYQRITLHRGTKLSMLQSFLPRNVVST